MKMQRINKILFYVENLNIRIGIIGMMFRYTGIFASQGRLLVPFHIYFLIEAVSSLPLLRAALLARPFLASL
jgi:hypothetical protein